MVDVPEHEPHHRPHPPSMGDAFMEFDLTAELERLKDEATWSTGQNARTLIKYDHLRVVLTALQAGATMPDHQTDGRVSVQVLSGHVLVRASGRAFNLRTGGLLALDQGIRHDVTAIEESALLLTIGWPGKG